MIQQIENEQIFATVVAVKDEDRRLNFNFSSDGIAEAWCLGSLNIATSIRLKAGDKIYLVGYWTKDFYGHNVAFFAEHLEKVG
ncbi:MAG: hypothetical protein ABSA45_10630 [Verrucomicrobiota bacterium]|jgi:hypothetical protein